MNNASNIVIDMDAVVSYIKGRLDIDLDRDTIENILDLEMCFLEEKGIVTLNQNKINQKKREIRVDYLE